MAELKIVPIIPDEDDEPRSRRSSARSNTKAPRVPKADGDSPKRGSRKSTEAPPPDPSLKPMDSTAVADEVRERYRMDKVKVEDLGRSRVGIKSHKTGATRRG